MEYPLFFYQPWPLIMSVIGLTIGGVSAVAATLAWSQVWKMARTLDTMRWVLHMQQINHEEEVRHLIKQMGGTPRNGAGHTVQ